MIGAASLPLPTNAAQEVGGNLQSIARAVGTPNAVAPAGAAQASGVDESGVSRTILTDQFGRVLLPIDAVDIRGSLRTESATAIQMAYAAYVADTDRFGTVQAGGGTVTYNGTTGEYEVSSAAATPSSAVLIHNYVGHYIPNHPMRMVVTGSIVNASPAAGQRLEMACTSGVASGLATADAIGFCVDASQPGTGSLCIFYRSSIAGGPNVTTRQSLWNIDKLDGAGPSRYSMTSAQAQKINYYKVELLWLGAWGIRWYVNGFVVHQILFRDAANAIVEPFARNPHLRIYVWINNSSLAAANGFHYNCGVIETLGGGEPVITSFSANRSAAVAIAAAGSAPMIGIRSVVTLGGVPNGKRIIPVTLALYGSQVGRISVYYGLVTDFALVGAAWATPPNSANTSAEVDVSSTAIAVGAGAWRLGGFMTNAQSETFVLTQFFDQITRNVGIRGDGSQTAVFIVVENTGTGPGTYILGGLNWHEEG